MFVTGKSLQSGLIFAGKSRCQPFQELNSGKLRPYAQIVDQACQRQTLELTCLFISDEEKSLIILTKGVCVTKLFSCSLMTQKNKLGCLSLATFLACSNIWD